MISLIYYNIKKILNFKKKQFHNIIYAIIYAINKFIIYIIKIYISIGYL